MRRGVLGTTGAAGVIALVAASMQACSAQVPALCDFGVCEALVDGNGGEDASASADGADAGCDTSLGPKDNGCVNTEAIAVYVAPTGDDKAGDGTKGKPFATIAKGVLAAKASNRTAILACAGTYAEKVTIDALADGVRIFGGLACPPASASDGGADAAADASDDASDGAAADGATDAGAAPWTYTGAKAIVAPADSGVPLTVKQLTTGFVMEDVEVDAKDAADPGASSIAVLVANAPNVVFRRVTMKAGKGHTGADGTTVTNFSDPQAKNGIASTDATGASGPDCSCLATPDHGYGGGGGNGSMTGPTGGGTGAPDNGGAAPNDGKGGAGEVVGGNACTVGDRGAPGAPGNGALGATTLGTLDASGFHPAPGSDGQPGKLGQGGGGGGGAKYLATPTGGGGSGGCGGCGGGGGTGGAGGGSSIALAIVASGVKLDGCSLQASDGGSGGKGGDGHAGQPGGDHGNGAGNGCSGGGGGTGGAGGGGGGGGGGHSLAIAFTPNPPTEVGAATVKSLGKPGSGGGPGTGGATAATKGTDGVAMPSQKL